MKYILLFLTFSFFIAVSNDINAQCCAAGNPVSSNCTIGDYGKDMLSVSIYHIYSNSDTYFNGTEKLDKEYIKTAYNFTYLSISYGLTSKLKLLADAGYFANKSQIFVNQNYERFARGIGDLNIGISYDTYSSEDEEFRLSQTARVTVPIGEFKQVFDGIELPIDLQSSSGNYKINYGISLSKRFGNSGFSLFSVNSFEMSQFIKTSTSNYKYGNLYNLSLIGAYRISNELNGLLQLRCEIRDKALNNSISEPNRYSYINSTGGVIAFISPQVNYTFNNDWTVSLQVNYPFFKNVYGEQLTSKYSIQAGISKSFDFSSDDDEESEAVEETTTYHDPSLLTKSIFVEGLCEMCKARIEKVAKKFSLVEDADWVEESKMLTIYYKDAIPDILGIQKELAAKGHDNDLFKAEDNVYNKLPSCCHYRKK